MEKAIQKLINDIPKSIRDTFVPVSFDVGDHIIEINSDVKYGYIFLEGAIDVMHINSNDTLYVYCQDYNANFVGLMEIYSFNDKYCCTCRARKKCVGYRLSKDVFLRLLEECDSFKTFLIKYWANQFYNQALNRTQYPNNSTEEKVLNYIVELSDKIGTSTQTVEIAIKRDEIAEYIGCSKRTIFRILNHLESEEFLSKKGHRLVVNPTQRNRMLKKIKKKDEK